MKQRHRQSGMTAIGWLLVLGLIAFFTLITLRLVPMYLEYSKVTAVFEGLTNEPGLALKTKTEIRNLIFKRFDVNDVRDFKRDAISITKKDGIVTIAVEYERRENVIGNVDVVARFDKSVEVRPN